MFVNYYFATPLLCWPLVHFLLIKLCKTQTKYHNHNFNFFDVLIIFGWRVCFLIGLMHILCEMFSTNAERTKHFESYYFL